MRSFTRSLVLPALILVLFGAACGKGEAPAKETSSPKSQNPMPGTQFRSDGDLSILAPGGDLRASFEIEVASNEKAIMQGLMFRESMDPSRAMLFDPQGLSDSPFWMKNTYIPLDIIFIDEEKQIMHIAERTTPFSEATIEAGGIYRWVLEINAGQAKQHQLSIGDRVKWNLRQ